MQGVNNYVTAAQQSVVGYPYIYVTTQQEFDYLPDYHGMPNYQIENVLERGLIKYKKHLVKQYITNLPEMTRIKFLDCWFEYTKEHFGERYEKLRNHFIQHARVKDFIIKFGYCKVNEDGAENFADVTTTSYMLKRDIAFVRWNEDESGGLMNCDGSLLDNYFSIPNIDDRAGKNLTRALTRTVYHFFAEWSLLGNPAIGILDALIEQGIYFCEFDH